MKKLLISASALALMSFTANKVIDYKLSESINNIQDMKEWMMQDIEQGRIDPELGEYYIQYLDETEDHLIELAEENRL